MYLYQSYQAVNAFVTPFEMTDSPHLLFSLPVGQQLLQVPAFVLGLQVLEAHGLQRLEELLLVSG